MDRYFAQVLPTDKADYVEKLQQEGRKVCFVGDGVNDAIALKKANVSISLRGATSIATDTAHVVFMEPSSWQALRIARRRRRTPAQRPHQLGVDPAPNILCIVGVFTFGFGIAASVLTNNVAALGALGNGVRPMRRLQPTRPSADTCWNCSCARAASWIGADAGRSFQCRRG